MLKLNMTAYLAISTNNLFTNIKLGDQKTFSYDIPYTYIGSERGHVLKIFSHFTTYPFWLARMGR